ncbi:uncharacterized protein STAUR_7045 [Stigmatella aurantiaca DW4/3-1]|uniref:Uncharacterized protein n=1 Tax=Stigmatella aurantiaca (strain DW4/3-1) TaxID=378806 RepID=E3FXK6_STIAD|nr:uncharacterized protein STAUR_7045 [Stigmatella aurantiaca DW4/3-1]
MPALTHLLHDGMGKRIHEERGASEAHVAAHGIEDGRAVAGEERVRDGAGRGQRGIGHDTTSSRRAIPSTWVPRPAPVKRVAREEAHA